MAIESSGAISLGTRAGTNRSVSGELGGSAPHAMSEYYKGGANVHSGNSDVPTSGMIKMSDFHGAKDGDPTTFQTDLPSVTNCNSTVFNVNQGTSGYNSGRNAGTRCQLTFDVSHNRLTAVFEDFNDQYGLGNGAGDGSSHSININAIGGLSGVTNKLKYVTQIRYRWHLYKMKVTHTDNHNGNGTKTTYILGKDNAHDAYFGFHDYTVSLSASDYNNYHQNWRTINIGSGGITSDKIFSTAIQCRANENSSGYISVASSIIEPQEPATTGAFEGYYQLEVAMYSEGAWSDATAFRSTGTFENFSARIQATDFERRSGMT